MLPKGGPLSPVPPSPAARSPVPCPHPVPSTACCRLRPGGVGMLGEPCSAAPGSPPAAQRTELLRPPLSARAVTGLEIQVPSLGVSRGAEEGLAAAGGGAAAGVSLPSDPPRRARPRLGEQRGTRLRGRKRGCLIPAGPMDSRWDRPSMGSEGPLWRWVGGPGANQSEVLMGTACRAPSSLNAWARMGLCGERCSGNAPCPATPAGPLLFPRLAFSQIVREMKVIQRSVEDAGGCGRVPQGDRSPSTNLVQDAGAAPRRSLWLPANGRRWLPLRLGAKGGPAVLECPHPRSGLRDE